MSGYVEGVDAFAARLTVDPDFGFTAVEYRGPYEVGVLALP